MRPAHRAGAPDEFFQIGPRFGGEGPRILAHMGHVPSIPGVRCVDLRFLRQEGTPDSRYMGHSSPIVPFVAEPS
ncbi:hypothetical protein GCM10010376_92050 [Streptomyces violaceusniger]